MEEGLDEGKLEKGEIRIGIRKIKIKEYMNTQTEKNRNINDEIDSRARLAMIYF